MPAFTVIITTFKRAVLLKRAIDSVLKQTYTDFECIVINDEPLDNELIGNIVGSLNDGRFSFVQATGNYGGNFCRNLGIARATGNYIAFLDDDDIWFPEKLAEHLKVHAETNADLVFSSYILRWLNAETADKWEKGEAEPNNIVKLMLKGQFSIGTTSSVTIKNTDGIQNLFDTELVSFQDWDAWLSMALNNPEAIFKKIDKPLLYFVQHDADRTSKNFQKRSKGLEQILSKYSDFREIKSFYNKERFNIAILKVKGGSLNPLLKKAFLLYMFVIYPPFWLNYYAIKRTGKYMLKAK